MRAARRALLKTPKIFVCETQPCEVEARQRRSFCRGKCMLRTGKRPLKSRHLCVPKPRFPVAKPFFVIVIFGLVLDESRWLSFFPLIFPAPSWVPQQFAPLIGVPWKPEKDWYSKFGQDKWAASESCFEKKGMILPIVPHFTRTV